MTLVQVLPESVLRYRPDDPPANSIVGLAGDTAIVLMDFPTVRGLRVLPPLVDFSRPFSDVLT